MLDAYRPAGKVKIPKQAPNLQSCFDSKQMFVYILKKVYAWDDIEIVGYFSTEQKAEKAKKKWHKSFHDYLEITKQEVK